MIGNPDEPSRLFVADKYMTSLLNRASDWMAEHHLSFKQLHEKDVSMG